ncbi:hypothetical protein A0J48_005925 [Sphaerospermopsis aphanizomenoides BCCUSP55]|uniref:hypothetical protein n=1 Tax=Sphaerospermopsis aphanizomenoides TaxID=459663 RepID=UPI0019031972|nr:hypothetical protein [Sphaerospermopsis aphanizomenoides]MBK1987078.1 hypothetical protein [Sphaerospermopsis aphanizomenoides BCCUSP55]
MNIHTFDNNYVTCPICQRNNRTKPVKTYIGLFTCPYCQERLVVCQSGHYVRDPFIWKQILMASALRRQSRPLARMIRDLVLIQRPLVALAMGGVILLATIAATQEMTNYKQQVFPGTEKVNRE